MKRYSARQIRRTLRKHDTKETAVQLGDAAALDILEITDSYALLDRLLEQDEAVPSRRVRFPYWAEIWPASLALSSWFEDADIETPKERVKELGCGLGVVGISLAQRGFDVEATDFVEDALVFASHNAARNGVNRRHRVSYLDWSHPVGRLSDCLVGSDVTYERKSHQFLYRVIRKLLAPGGRLYLSDPQRPVAKAFFASLEGQGFDHFCETRTTRWKAMEHQIDIHVFVKPDHS